MSKFTIQFLSEQEIVKVQMTGEFDLQLFNKSTLKIKEKLSCLNCNRVLSDHREAWPDISALGLYDSLKFASSIGLSRTVKFAIIYSKRANDYKFVETVARNNGFNWRVFTDIDEGLKWLKK